jgi:2-haloacid dehalogenase
MKYDYLTFDCYATLIDWKAGIAESLGRGLRNLGLSNSKILSEYTACEHIEETSSSYKTYKEVLRDSAIAMSKKIGGSLTNSEAEDFARSLPRWPCFPDSSKVLKSLGESGFKRYILSNVDEDLLQETIDRNGFEIDGHVTSEETHSYKPAPAHWLRFFEKTRAKKGRVLHVAQSFSYDIVPAQSLGIECVWVNRYGESLPASHNAEFEVDSLDALLKLLNDS